MSAWIAVGISLFSALISFVIVFTFLRAKVDELSRQLAELKKNQEGLEVSLEETQKSLTTAIELLKVHTAEQSVLNTFTSKILTSLTEKMEKTDVRLIEIHAVSSFIKEAYAEKANK